MKFLISLAIFFSLIGFAEACENFAGTYQFATNPSELTLTVTQTGCSSVTFTYFYPASGENLVQSLTTDGQRRQTSQDATQIVYETAQMSDTDMTNTVEFYQIASKTETTAITTYTLDGSGNLLGQDNYYDNTGKLYSTDQRNFNKAQ